MRCLAAVFYNGLRNPAGEPGLRLGWPLALLLQACSLGAGEGAVSGLVSAPPCELEGSSYSLDPTFFAAGEAAEGALEIRVQRGSDLESFSDGIALLVLDPEDIQRNRLGEAIPIRPVFDNPVRMSFYLNETCAIGRDETPVNYEAVDGDIVFSRIYAPTVGGDDVETAAEFRGVLFQDPRSPIERSAVLSGNFRFLFSRGRPAQRFP